MNEAQMITAGDRDISLSPGGSLKLQDRATNEADIGAQARPRAGQGGGMQTTVGYLLILMIVYIGWQRRGNVYISPEEGAGYALGIIGGSMMLLLLLYPMRKHLRWTHGFGPVRHWFRAHMLMGIIGPVCILYHCNFQLGSANGNVALFSMLLVAGSGLAGRYIYTKMHYGLYGRKADLDRLNGDRAMAMSSMGRVLEACPGLLARLQKLEQQAVMPLHGILPGLVRVLAVGIKAHWCWILSGPVLRNTIRGSGWATGLNAVQRKMLLTSYQVLPACLSANRLQGRRSGTLREAVFALAYPAPAIVFHAADIGDCACVCGAYVLARRSKLPHEAAVHITGWHGGHTGGCGEWCNCRHAGDPDDAGQGDRRPCAI